MADKEPTPVPEAPPAAPSKEEQAAIAGAIDAAQGPEEDVIIPRGMAGDAGTGKLPDDLVRKWVKDTKEFVRLWKDAENWSIQVPYLVELGWEEPFFGSLSRRITKTRTASIPTAGVRVISGMLEMMWNPVFFKHELEKTSREHPKGVIKHELYHVIFEHITTRRQRPHVLWNAATDCAINSLIPRKELPDFGLVPGEMFVPPDAKPDWKPSILSRLIKTLPKEKSSEWYLQAFLADPEVQEAMERAKEKAAQRAQARQQAKGQPGPGQPGQGDPSKQGDQGDHQDGQDQDDPSGGKGPPQQERDFNKALEEELYGKDGGQFDDHDMWDELSDAERDMMRDYIRDIFRDCVREAERQANGWGSVPESIRQHLKKLISREVDWRELLAQFIGRSRSTKTTSSIKRVNRRVPWEFPGRKRTYSARPGVAIDQSGSMTDWWVELLFAEMGNLGNLTEFDVIPFDYTVDEPNIQRIRRGQQPNPIRTRSGGTSFDAPVEYFNKHRERYDCGVILTDGGCGSPKKCEIPLAYILAPGCELMFEAPEGVPVFKMTDSRQKT